MKKIYTAVLRDILNFVTYKMGHCVDAGGSSGGGHCSGSTTQQAPNQHCYGHCY